MLLFCGTALLAQNEPMQVVRCLAIEPDQAIRNIFVDESNQKWVGNGSMVYQVKALDLATPLALNPGEQSLLSIAGGNADIRWNVEKLQSLLKIKLSADNRITTGYYDAQKDLLLLGTSASGFFELKTKPSLQLLSINTTANSKVRSNNITTIYRDSNGKIWIGTDQGLLQGSTGKWELVNKYFNVAGIQTYLPFTYVLSDGQLWRWDGKGEWEDYGFDERMIDGNIASFTLDLQGRFWIASEILARYDPEIDKFQTFGPADYYTSQFPTCLTLDKEGALWVGTEDKGVYLVEKASALTLNLITGILQGCDPSGMTIKAKITGGKAPFTYDWSNGQKTETAKDLGPGEYTVTVTDAAGLKKTSKANLPDPRITLKVSQQSEESAANAKDAVAAAIATGGSPAYSYQWDNGETSNIALKLGEGQHTVTVKDKMGCSAQGTVTITQKAAALRVVLTEKQKLNCNGDKTAALALTVSGGKAPLQYQWNNAALSGDAPSGLAAGDYLVTVTDAVGQKASANVKVEQPLALNVKLQVQSPATTNNADGKAQAQLNGGTAPYTYAWDNGETTALATKLAPGTRNLTVTDSKGCTTQSNIEIAENVLALNATLRETKKLDCAGAKDAALEVEVNGGKPPFTYQWNAAGLNGGKVAGLSAGEYSVTISDASGKSVSSHAAIGQPNPIQIQIQAQALASTGNADGKATAQVNGGTGAYTYSWDNGENLPSASRLAAGKHTLTVTDAKGCKAEASSSISENILDLVVSLSSKTSISCNGAKDGALQAFVKGGKGPYVYKWSSPELSGTQVSGLAAGEYTVSVSDASGKNASATFKVEQPNPIQLNINVIAQASTGNADGKATAQASGGNGNFVFKWDNNEAIAAAVKLAPGKHTVTVTDSKGCVATSSVDITENIFALEVSLEEKAAIQCNGAKTGAISATVKGGKGPYVYKWSNPELQGTQASGLAAGEYTLSVSDASGKNTSANFKLEQPNPIQIKINVMAPASTGNADGKATAQASGGNGNFAFKWDNNEAIAAAVKLAPGKHTVTVTDSKGCVATSSVDITENIFPLEVSLEEKATIQCNGAKTSTVAATVKGGKGPFRFQWSDPSINGEQANALAAGNYSLTVTDALGSQKTTQISLNQPEAIAIAVTRKYGVTAETATDGLATVAVKGGAAPLKFAWSNAETLPTAQKLGLGKNTLTVTDAKGCTAQAVVEITKKNIPELTAGRIRNGQAIRVEQLQFDIDSINIKASFKPILDEVFDFLTDNPSIVVEVGGHTNGLCQDEFCIKLSTARAKSVAEYLINRGIDAKRVLFKGYGRTVPIATNSTPEGRQKNQRVEIKIVRMNQ